MFYFKSFESDTTQRCVRPANRYETDEFASERFVWSSSTGNVADPDKSGRSTRVPLTWNIFLRSTWTHFVDLIWKHSTGFFSTWKKKVQTLRNESAIFRTFDPSNSSARNFSNKMTSVIVGFHCFTQWICNSMWNCAKEDERLHLLAEHHQKRAKAHQRSQLALTDRPRPVDKKIQIFLPMEKKVERVQLVAFLLTFYFWKTNIKTGKADVIDNSLNWWIWWKKNSSDPQVHRTYYANDSQNVSFALGFFFSSAPLNHLLKLATS